MRRRPPPAFVNNKETSTMKRAHLLVASIAAFSLVAAACGGDDDDASDVTTAPAEAPTETTEAPTETTEAPTETTEAPTESTEAPTETTEAPTETTEPPVVRAEGDLVIWADDIGAPVLRPFAEQFAEENGVSVVVQEVTPFEDIDDRVIVAGPAGEGPDIFVGAHDSLGGLVDNGSVAPIDLGAREGDFAPSSVQAMNFGGTYYGLPYATENIALIRNVDLVPEAPATFEELVEIAQGYLDDGTAEIGIAVEQGGGAPYHNYPIVTGLGGYVFGVDDDGSYNPDDLGIDSEGSLAAASLMADLADRGLMSWDLDGDQMRTLFGEGKAPFAITGPWSISAFDDAGVNYVVEPIPPIDGGEPAPFVGVRAFFISAFAENPLLAQTFVVDFMGSEEAALALFEADPRPPALTAAFEAVSDDPNIAGFGLSGLNGQPMPAIPEMGSVWSAWTDAYQLVLTGSGDPDQAFTDAATQIRNLIAG
jgi:arabinogalactan oligomer / maltooligosaccharide transport system substrate-binding protein